MGVEIGDLSRCNFTPPEQLRPKHVAINPQASVRTHPDNKNSVHDEKY